VTTRDGTRAPATPSLLLFVCLSRKAAPLSPSTWSTCGELVEETRTTRAVLTRRCPASSLRPAHASTHRPASLTCTPARMAIDNAGLGTHSAALGIQGPASSTCTSARLGIDNAGLGTHTAALGIQGPASLTCIAGLGIQRPQTHTAVLGAHTAALGIDNVVPGIHGPASLTCTAVLGTYSAAALGIQGPQIHTAAVLGMNTCTAGLGMHAGAVLGTGGSVCRRADCAGSVRCRRVERPPHTTAQTSSPTQHQQMCRAVGVGMVQSRPVTQPSQPLQPLRAC